MNVVEYYKKLMLEAFKNHDDFGGDAEGLQLEAAWIIGWIRCVRFIAANADLSAEDLEILENFAVSLGTTWTNDMW